MSDDRGDRPDGGQNPFEGTPFEQLFRSFTGGLGGGATGPGGMPAGMPDLSALMGQVQHLFAPHEGPVNWTLALDVARKAVAQQPDPSPTQRQADAVADAVRLADHWLDTATGFPSGVTRALV